MSDAKIDLESRIDRPVVCYCDTVMPAELKKHVICLRNSFVRCSLS